MKVSAKLFALVIAPMAIVGLASCSPSNDETAIKKVSESTALILNGNDPVMASATTDMEGDKDHSLTLTTKYTVNANGERKTVSIAWSWAEAYDALVYERAVKDDTHEGLYFNYPKKGESDAAFVLDATLTSGSVTKTVPFKLNLKAETLIWDTMSLEEMYAVKGEGEARNYWFVDDANDKIVGNHGQTYPYVIVSGKITYLSEDGNWGLLEDGEHTVEIYSGSAYDLNPNSRPACKVGNYVTVRGNISHYFGNIQIGFISQLREMSDHSSITEPVEMGALDEAAYKALDQYSGVGNRRASFASVAYVGGSIKDKGGATISAGAIKTTERFTFQVKLGSTTVTIAFDYHTNPYGEDAVGASIQEALLKCVSGTHLTISGTLRFATIEDKNNVWQNAGAYQLVPLGVGDVALAE